MRCPAYLQDENWILLCGVCCYHPSESTLHTQRETFVCAHHQSNIRSSFDCTLEHAEHSGHIQCIVRACKIDMTQNMHSHAHHRTAQCCVMRSVTSHIQNAMFEHLVVVFVTVIKLGVGIPRRHFGLAYTTQPPSHTYIVHTTADRSKIYSAAASKSKCHLMLLLHFTCKCLCMRTCSCRATFCKHCHDENVI